jgi:isopropylmalate/homocitrate/citramalate synthase
MPQMADAEDLLRGLGSRRQDVVVSGLVPNDRGFERALRMHDEGLLDQIFLVFAESQTALAANGFTLDHEALIHQMERAAAEAQAVELGVSIFVSTAYGCSVEGYVDPSGVVTHAERLASIPGVSELVISDTTGQADPIQVLRMLSAVSEVVPADLRIAAHFHDTRGAGLANVFAALISPVEHLVIDGAFGGWGGDWPMLKEAYGNVATEDVVEFLVGLGIDVGVDVDRITAISRDYSERTGRPVIAKLPTASPISWKHERLVEQHGRSVG